MVTDDLPTAFDQLASFGRAPDVAIRPVLLRVMVDMFANKPHHAAVEIRQFEEILSHILGDADPETRLAVAEKLSRHPQTPRSLLERLLADRDAAATTVVALAALDSPALGVAAVLGTTEVARAAAERPDLDPETVRKLAERPEAAVLHALAGNPAAPISATVLRYLARRARNDNVLAAKLLARPGAQPDAASLFLSASRDQRHLMIADARRRDLGATSRSVSAQVSPDALSAIERAARHAGLEGLDIALTSALGLSSLEVERILDDTGGEPLALVLAAIGVPLETAGRVFLLGDPALAPSYQRLKALLAIVETVSPRTALRLVLGMLGRSPDMPRRPSSAAPFENAGPRRSSGIAPRAEATGTERTTPAVLRRLGRD